MKLSVLIICLFTFIHSHAQKSTQIAKIDRLVSQINSSGLELERDTIIYDFPEMNIYIVTYLSAIIDNGEIIKYVNDVNGKTMENGILKETIGVCTFYFKDRELIKEEEYSIENDLKTSAEWYYWNDKPIYNTSDKADSEKRAAKLLEMSKVMTSAMYEAMEKQ